MNDKPERNAFYVVVVSPQRWGDVAGDYPTESGARVGLAYWRRTNPDIQYDIYYSQARTRRGIVPVRGEEAA
jgi:hypothetical protein